MKKTALKPVKISKADIVTVATQHGWKHLHSENILSEIRILRVQLDELKKRETAWTAALNTTREQRTDIEAQLRGLETIIERR